MLTWGLIGVVSGLLLGITGAGGAVISVPLFVYLVELNIREATALSLVAVITGSLLNWLIQIRNTDFVLVAVLFVSSMMGALPLRSIKAEAPEWIITSLFVLVVLGSLLSIWKKREAGSRPSGVRNRGKLLLKSSLGGLSLGGVITMTGLGGGVVIIPFLMGVCGLSLPRAAATSLLTILLSSVFSLWIQRGFVAGTLDLSLLSALLAGSILSAVGTREILRGIAPDRLDHVRRLLITIVIVISVVSLIFREAVA